MLDAADFGRNPHGGEFGRCQVRFGKAKKGSPPKRRGVLTVFDWTPDVLDEWFTEVCPLFGTDNNPAAWPSERGLRIGCQRLNFRFIAYRKALGLDDGLDFRSFRRYYATHLTRTAGTRASSRSRSATSTPAPRRSTPACPPTSAPCAGIWIIVLLYPQPVSRIVRLSVDDVIRDGDTVLLRLGEPASPVPAPVAALLLTTSPTATT
ncbi:hypothetical protein ACWD01_20955 [Streptomyces sp. NPDC002835]